KVVSIAKQSLMVNKRKLIVCAGDPEGREALNLIKQNFTSEIVSFLMPSGANGRGHSIRAILELARFFKSDVVLLEADLISQGESGIKPDWVDRMAKPIFEDYDMSIASFKRHPFEDIIGKILVAPVIAALYGTKFSDPLSGVFAISHDLVEEFCSEFDQSREYLGGYGINPWLITTALKLNKKICEVNLGAKLSPVSSGKKYIVIKEMLRVLFECIKRDEEIWLKDSGIIKTPDVFTIEQEDVPLKVCCNFKEYLDSFLEGMCHYDSSLQKVLNKEMFMHIENMTKSYIAPDYSPDIWAKIAYRFILTDNFSSEILQEDLLEAFLVIYNGMVASLIRQIEKTKKSFKDTDIDMDAITSSQIEVIYKNTAMAFIKYKAYFLEDWRQKVEATSPVLTPLDYLEFIPGVPIVLPKKIYGRGKREVNTGEVFKRLQEKYNCAFTSFLNTINLDENASSQEIGRRLTEVMEELEYTIDSLCPGDLYSLEGTEEVVNHIFKIFPHNKVLAVKWQVLRKLLQEYPPGNLILRMGFR
ncbi:MAG: glycosidase, partial [Thermoanaerobacteraceae bacterium]|nr:glycosidase [Thermoanaerobacteraceae bacterium]